MVIGPEDVHGTECYIRIESVQIKEYTGILWDSGNTIRAKRKKEGKSTFKTLSGLWANNQCKDLALFHIVHKIVRP